LWSSLEESALKKRYVVRLSGVEREQLEGLVGAHLDVIGQPSVGMPLGA